MRTFLLAALLTSSALAGGAGPRPAFPLAVGQTWEIEWRFADEPAALQRVTVEAEFPKPRSAEALRSFRIQGGALTAFLPVRFLIVTQDGFINRLCIAPISALSSGHALRGTAEALGALVPQKHVNHNPTDADLYGVARKAGHGTCALGRRN
ncbi:hypothetical protein SAMN04488058_10752 [Deinococcus reticulitermitis]|uniref:Uncharacterized protein n=1 Tax=Deinococcus reticulitermitis TaxID=856736 RepID=A0A1H6YBB2_9DEIO|nr:hypothetical protein [Deinococcus reticulitermitis]SEJ38541.1 hypothetical protein SAMN04488058_10752 [Deinococcus reticulitermitis]